MLGENFPLDDPLAWILGDEIAAGVVGLRGTFSGDPTTPDDLDLDSADELDLDDKLVSFSFRRRTSDFDFGVKSFDDDLSFGDGDLRVEAPADPDFVCDAKEFAESGFLTGGVDLRSCLIFDDGETFVIMLTATISRNLQCIPFNE